MTLQRSEHRRPQQPQVHGLDVYKRQGFGRAGLGAVALLQPQGIEKIVVVTHAHHMSRALRNFERAVEGHKMAIVGASMGGPTPGPLETSDWLPSVRGFEATWIALHEWLGMLAGA